MSITKPTVDNKGMSSSLSADAAEFVPKFSASQVCSAVATVAATSLPRRKGDKPVQVTEVPGYLTSCYPFVSPENAVRHQFARFPQQYPYTAGLSPSLSMTVTPPIRFPTWQTVKPEFIGNLQTSSYGSMPFDLLTSLPVDMSNVRSDSLLLTPSKVAMPVQPSPAPGLLLTPHADSAALNSAAWIMAMSSPVFLQQQQSQQLHSSLQQVPPTVTTGKESFVPAALSSKKQSDRSKGKMGSANQREVKQQARPESPVLISRSTQTDLPPLIRNLTLEERPHPLYVSHSHKNPPSSRSGVNCEGDNWKTGNEDSDSGYNSPMHKKNLVSSGTQVVPGSLHSDERKLAENTHVSGKSWGKQQNMQTHHLHSDERKLAENTHVSGKSWGKQQNMQTHHLHSDERKLAENTHGSGKSWGKQQNMQTHHLHQGLQDIGAVDAAILKCESGDRLSEDVELDEQKKRRKKKDHRDMSRSPRLLGTNTKLLSRSSSSVSSSGTKPDEDDEKIDLHSWTDFPPVSSRIAAPLTSSKHLLKSPLSPNERVPLTVERSAHEPPWSIKFSSADQLRSERHRSSSGDKDKCLSPKINSPPESAWGRIGRSFRSSQTVGPGHELSRTMSNTEKVPLLNSGGKADCSVAGDTSRVASAETISRNPSLQQNKNNSSLNRVSDISRPDHKQEVELVAAAKVSYSHTASSSGINKHLEQDTAKLASLVHAGSVTLNQPVISASSSPLPASPIMLQSSSLINQAGVPLMHIRPGSQHGLAPGINYHLTEPFQRPSLSPGGNSIPSHAFTSAINSTERTYPVRPPNPILLPRGTTSHTSHSFVPPFQGGSVAFTQPPPSHLNVSSVPFSGYNGVMTYPSPMLNTSGMVSNGPYHHSELGLQPPTVAYTSGSMGVTRNFHYYGPSHTGAAALGGSSTAHSPLPASTVTDVKSQSIMSASVQQHKLVNEPNPANVLDSPQNSEFEGNKKRRRRRRRRSKLGNRETDEAEEGSDGSQVQGQTLSGSVVSESVLHFEDVDEFPDLLTSNSHGHPQDIEGHERSTLSGTSITYSDILKSTWSKAGSQSQTQSLTGSCVSGDVDEEGNTSCHTGTTNESKRARKRRKRREQANKAAEAELAEISLEQQWLKEGLKKPANHRTAEGGAGNGKATPGLITNSYVINEAKKQTSGKGGDRKSQQPIAFDIAAMIDAIQKKPVAPTNSTLIKPQHTNSMVSKKEQFTVSSASLNLPGNMLDSSAPLLKRGKEREVGKTKKPSPLKKVILKEREQRKMLMLLDEDPDSASGLGTVGTSSGVGIVGGESELSQDALSNKSGETNSGDANGAAELSADFSPISQTSPISMSPASPGNSGVNSPITGSVGRDPVVMKIHSRRFREYCTQILDKEIDQCCTSLLQDLVKFQDRMYHKDPVKAKSKRRLVLGLREVTKHLKLKKIKCVVISPNLEKIQSKGGLDEALNNILNMCREQNIPFVFALGRRALGRACAKLVPVSVVGIFNYEGCENKYQSLISLTAAARSAYNEMVLAVEKEVAEYPTMLSQTSSIGGVPGLFAAHMGHSRTPSGCSAISFTSSILSEPISENFPHAEPEVDSKGYEIVRDAAGNVVHPAGSSSKGAGLAPDIDDGNEADTEDFGETRKKRRDRPINSVRFGGIGDVIDSKDSGIEPVGEKKNRSTSFDSADDGDERSTIGKLSRNVSELTLTNEDNFTLKGEHYAMKHKSHLMDSEDDREKFDIDTDPGNTGAGNSDPENVYRGSKSPRSNAWAPVPHIDSIHSQSYNLGDEILGHHSTQSRDCRIRGNCVTFVQNSELSPAASGGGGDDLHTGQISDFADRDDDDDDDNNIDDAANIEGEEDEDEEEQEEEEEEEEAEDEASKRHHRVIDKERIKSWLESQSNISTED